MVTPEEKGFGSTLIERAVPHELGGEAELHFEPDGVRAKILLPYAIFENRPVSASELRPMNPIHAIEPKNLSLKGFEGAILLLEDNFIIAQEMADQIGDFGFPDVQVAANAEDALAMIERETPAIAILDVNLGGGSTSKSVALKLHELGVPFFFITGYGDDFSFGEDLDGVARMAKPVSTFELQKQLAGFLPDEP